MNITEQHLHHLARRNHATMQKLDAIKGRAAAIGTRLRSTLEMGFGAWAGGLLEGKTGGMAIGPLPINLLGGIALLGFGQLDITKGWGDDLSNVGNGLIGSYLAASGYALGKRWRDTGHFLGGGGHPFYSPYQDGWAHGGAAAPAAPAAPVSGDLSPQQMAAIVQQMQSVANAPSHP
jgi:hypothetical protein